MSISFKLKDIGYPFRLIKVIIELISVFSNVLFDEYKYARCNIQVIRPRFQDKFAMFLKYKSPLAKVGLRYKLISNSPSLIVTSTSKNGSELPETSSRSKRKLG